MKWKIETYPYIQCHFPEENAVLMIYREIELGEHGLVPAVAIVDETEDLFRPLRRLLHDIILSTDIIEKTNIAIDESFDHWTDILEFVEQITGIGVLKQ